MEKEIKLTDEDIELLLQLIRNYPVQGTLAQIEQISFRLRTLEKKLLDQSSSEK